MEAWTEDLSKDFPYENLVLEGGGAKGYAYIGALEVLEEQGLLNQFKRFAGASAGAIIAAFLALGADCKTLKIMGEVPLREIVEDACCSSIFVLKYIPMINNLLKRYGWNTGDGFLDYMKYNVKQLCGNPDITFAQVYDKTGKELCVTVANVSKMELEFFHPKLTPDVPIVLAVRMSMSIPGYFEPVRYKHNGLDNVFVDGGLLCNYPIHCFDGWYLSMEPEDAFLERIALDDVDSPFSPPCKKTLGMVVYSADDHDIMRPHVHYRYEGFDIERPKTPLSKKRAKDVKLALRQIETHNEILDVSARVGRVIIQAHKAHPTEDLTKDEAVHVFNQIGEVDYKALTGGKIFNPEQSYMKLYENTGGKVTFSSLVRYLDRQGLFYRELHEGSMFRADMQTAPAYFMSLLGAINLTASRYYVKSWDIERTVGVNTDYVQTLDFEMKQEDRQFMLKQGANAILGFLREREERGTVDGTDGPSEGDHDYNGIWPNLKKVVL